MTHDGAQQITVHPHIITPAPKKLIRRGPSHFRFPKQPLNMILVIIVV